MKVQTSDNNNSLFNEEAKKRFLAEIRESTRKSYERIFKITQSYESALEKDINQFTLQELETILYEFKANNRNTIESYSRIISSYLNWSVQEGLASENALAMFKPDDFDKYISNEEVYLTEKILKRQEDRCENYQDSVILRLLFIGVGGKQLSEIRNLNRNDIDYDKKQIRLVNTLKEDEKGNPIKFTERFLNIDEHTLKLIDGSLDQRKYIKRNGLMEQRENIRNYTDLVENDFVVRASITKTDNWIYPVDRFVIYRRVQMLSETLGLDLTTKFIQRSGMIYYAKELTKGEVEPSLDDLKMIADRFNMKSYHNLKGLLTLENIKKTYGELGW